jgi:hypothetical protein
VSVVELNGATLAFGALAVISRPLLFASLQDWPISFWITALSGCVYRGSDKRLASGITISY